MTQEASSLDSWNTKRTLTAAGVEYDYYSIVEAEAAGLGAISKLPLSMKILLENIRV